MIPAVEPSAVPFIAHHDPEHWPNLLIAPYLCPDFMILVAAGSLLTGIELYRRSRAHDFRVVRMFASSPLISFSSLAIAGIIASTLMVCFAPRYMAQAVPLAYVLLCFGLFGNGRHQPWKYAILALLVAVNVFNSYGRLFPSIDRGPGINHSEPEKAHERSHEYERYHSANQQAVQLLQKTFKEHEILVTAPFGHMLGVPQFGYASEPLKIACVGMTTEVYPFVRGPEETRFHDPIYVRDRYANLALIPAVEPEDEILFDDGLMPPLVIFRKRWQGEIPSNPNEIEHWFRSRGWVGGTMVDCARHRLLSLKWAGRQEQADQELEQLIQSLPASYELRAMWISTLMAKSQNAKAEHALREAIADFPNVAWFPASLGRVLLAQNRVEEAIRPIEISVQLAPDTPEILAGLADLRDRQGRWTEAEAIYRSVAGITDEPSLLLRLGDLLLREGKPKDALQYLNQANETRPGDPTVHRLTAKAWMSLGRPDEAIPELRKVLKAHPQDTENRLALAFALSQAGLSKESLPILRELSATQPDAKNLLAWILATNPDDRLRDGSEALALAQALATTGNDQNPEFLDTLAAAYAEVGRFDEAIQSEERYLRLIAPTGADKRVNEARQRLALYKKGQAFRQTRID